MLDQFLVLHEHVFLSQIADVTALQFFLQSSMFSCGKYVKSSISKVFCGTKSVVKQDDYLLSEQFKCIVLLYASVSRLNRSLILVWVSLSDVALRRLQNAVKRQEQCFSWDCTFCSWRWKLACFLRVHLNLNCASVEFLAAVQRLKPPLLPTSRLNELNQASHHGKLFLYRVLDDLNSALHFSGDAFLPLNRLHFERRLVLLYYHHRSGILLCLSCKLRSFGILLSVIHYFNIQLR